MPEAAWSDPSQADPRRETRVPSPPLTADQNAAVQPISIADVFAETRQGFVVRIARWDDSAASQLGRLEGDFRIAVLDEPPPAPIQPPPATIVCAPARPLEGTPAVRETAVPNGISRPEPLLTPAALRLLGQGKLYAHAELRITAQDAFADGQSRFDLLARELLTCEALARYLDPMAVALWAPDTPRRTSAEQRLAALGVLLRGAQAALPEAGPSAEAAAALDRISQLCAATDAESFLVSAHALYPHVPAFLEDIYLLRALAERPAEAREVLAMRAFIAQAALPPGDSDLSLDRAIADEQLQFASLVPEPQRLNAARAAFTQFCRRYRSHYQAHHRGYWTEMASLRGRLLEGKAHADALEKINTLTELGPPVGAGALLARSELLEESGGCPLIVDVEEELTDNSLCPACGLRLDQEPPSDRVAEVLGRIERALARQMARLSSVGVRQVLQGSGDARVERFLKVVQAAQLSSLVDIVDDELIGYLRRFLVESRIGALLDPVLANLEEGTAPKAEEAQEALREIARTLQRAFRAGGRALPAPRAALGDGLIKKPRR